jgi:hypothetical protein
LLFACYFDTLLLFLTVSGCTVRLWDVTRGGGGACLKLLQHGDSPVTAMTWTSTFRGAATIDGSGKMRCFNMVNSTKPSNLLCCEQNYQ